MKNIKGYNQFLKEYFDTEDLKAQSEIPYLRGEVKDELKRKMREMDAENKYAPKNTKKVYKQLIFNHPFLISFNASMGPGRLIFNTYQDHGDKENRLESSCSIIIDVNKDMTVAAQLNCFIKSESKGKDTWIFDETDSEGVMTLDKLDKIIKTKWKSIIEKWDDYNKSTLGVSVLEPSKEYKSKRFN